MKELGFKLRLELNKGSEKNFRRKKDIVTWI